MVSSKIISAIFNDYVFFAFLILFVTAGLVLMMKFKTLSKHKKRLLIVLFSISILVLSRFLYLSHQFGNNEPAYIKRGLSLLSSNDVQIEKVEMSERFLTVEGKIPHKLEFEEIQYEKEDDALYLMIFSNRKASEDEHFKCAIKGDFDNIKYVYVRSIEGGYGGLEDKLVYEK